MLNIFFTFLKIGAFTFGGGYAMIPLMQNELVEKQHLINKDEFIDYISIAQSYPGVLAVNISVLIGYKLYKIPGVIISALATALPSFCIVIIISYIYFSNSSSKILNGFFIGVSPVIIALMLNSFFDLFKKLPKTIMNICLLIISFVFVSFFKINPIYLIIIGGVYSLCRK